MYSSGPGFAFGSRCAPTAPVRTVSAIGIHRLNGVIPGRPKAEPGTQGPQALHSTLPWLPGSRFASPGMTIDRRRDAIRPHHALTPPLAAPLHQRLRRNGDEGEVHEQEGERRTERPVIGALELTLDDIGDHLAV